MGTYKLEHKILQQVKSYEQRVLTNQIQFPFGSCPRCHEQVGKFKRHEARSRIFKVIVGNMINKVYSLITRWKCPVCRKTFSVYPEFAFPYKRYVLPQIMNLSNLYLEDDLQTYRKAVTRDNAEYYHQKKSEEENVSSLAHSTLYRWITSLAGVLHTVSLALNYIKQKNPATSIFRKIAALKVCFRKYRSEVRKNKLLRCRTLLWVEKEFVRILSSASKKLSIFPNLATKMNWS